MEGVLTAIYVDGDACPVRDEVYRVAGRLGLSVFVVSNGSRPIRPPGLPNVVMITVAEGADVADDWIAERITAADVCVTADIPLASRCLTKGARAVSPAGKHWHADNIGNALAGREVSRHMREIGMHTGGPAPLTKADRSRFLSALDAAVQSARRDAGRMTTMNLKVAASSDDRALAIRDHVLPIVREHGRLEGDDSTMRLMVLERPPLGFEHWTPFNTLDDTEASSPGYRHALERQHTRPDLPYGLSIRHEEQDVLSLLWAEDGTFEVRTFLRGPWEDAALAL